MPRRAKTNPNFALSLAMRMSMGRVIVTPTPTAGPLNAPMTTFLHAAIRRATAPPASRGTPSISPKPRTSPTSSLSNVPAPRSRSAPAQNPRPAPVTTTTRTESSASASPNAAISSCAISSVNALSRAGRFNVIVAIPSAAS